MAFEDLPKVAPSRVQSAEAERAVAELFCEPRFVCRREDEPSDYGVDYAVELIVDGNATNFRAQLQLKSQAEGNYVDAGRFVSVKTEPGRLYYLARSGTKNFIVAYDAKAKICFFEWVENVISELDANPGRDGWRDQDEVWIRIPVANRLSEDRIELIHAAILDYCRRQAAIRAQSVTLAVPSGGSIDSPSTDPDGVAGDVPFAVDLRVVEAAVSRVGISYAALA